MRRCSRGWAASDEAGALIFTYGSPSSRKGTSNMSQIPPELIGRAVQDPDFRHRLLTDPQGAVAAAGFELDEDQIAALKQLDPEAVDEAIDALVGDIDSSKWG
jgi:hypothetical protein